MGLQFAAGSSTSAKTGIIYKTIIEQACRNKDINYIFMVPEQATLQVQRDLVKLHPAHVLSNIDVLSFGRLAHHVISEQSYKEAVLLDDTGKTMILRKTASRVDSKLSMFASNLRQKGFVNELKSILSEFTIYGVNSDKLDSVMDAIKDRPVLSRKICDVGMIYKEFQKEMGEKYMTSEELLSVLARLASSSKLIRSSVFILDGFTGFTPLQYQVLEQLLIYAKHMICLLTIDKYSFEKINSLDSTALFAMGSDVYRHLMSLAEKNNIEADEKKNSFIEVQDGFCREIVHIEKNLFRYPCRQMAGQTDNVLLIRASDPKEEMNFVLRRILELVRSKRYRYRDIAVVAGDLEVYGDLAEHLFQKEGIPCFIDSKKRLSSNALIQFIQGAVSVILEDYSYDSVISFLRNPFTQIDEEMTDRFDNYLLACGITSKRQWKKEWTYLYGGITQKELDDICGLKKNITEKLSVLEKVWNKKKVYTKEAAESLYHFMQQFDIQESLEKMTAEFSAEGMYYLESEYSQVYEKIIALFDQLVNLMGEDECEPEVLSDILNSGFEEMSVGFIPACIDRVVVGDMLRTRLDHIKVMFIVGCNDGLIPKTEGAGGILTDYDREILRERGLEIGQSAREEAFNQQYYIYLMMTKPSDKLILSFSETSVEGKALRPAHLIGAVMKLFPDKSIADAASQYEGIAYLVKPEDGMTLLAKGMRDSLDGGGEEWWRDLYNYYFERPQYSQALQKLLEGLFYTYKNTQLDKEIASKLFKGSGRHPVTRLEQYASCAYAHFLTYGLQLKKRQEFELRSADYGTLFHASVNGFFELLEKNGLVWKNLDDNTRNMLAEQSVENAMINYNSMIFEGNARNKSMAERIKRMTKRTLWALSYQWDKGNYNEVRHEVPFGYTDKDMVKLSLKDGMKLILNGRIDRIDIAECSGRIYVKVIDYKSGNTKFDISKLYYGLSLQLILYLEASQSIAKKSYKDKEIVPAGIYYYNMKDPVIDAYGKSEEEIEQAQLKELKMNGLTNSDETALMLLDEEGGNVVNGIDYNKDHTLSKRAVAADAQDFDNLKKYAVRKAQRLADDIFDGKITPDPYEYGQQTACTYCEYNPVCAFDTQIAGCSMRRLKSCSMDEIWKLINEDLQSE